MQATRTRGKRHTVVQFDGNLVLFGADAVQHSLLPFVLSHDYHHWAPQGWDDCLQIILQPEGRDFPALHRAEKHERPHLINSQCFLSS